MGGEKKDKEEWPDDTPISDILEVLLSLIRQTELNDEDTKLVETWTEVLNTNLYDTFAHLRDIDADEWAAMKLPLRLRTMGRKNLWPQTPSRVDLTSSMGASKRKTSKKNKHSPSVATEAVKKARNIGDFARKKRPSLTESGIQSIMVSSKDEKTQDSSGSKVRMKVEESNSMEKDKDKEKDKEKRRNFARSAAVSKLKSWRDLTKAKDEKEDSSQMFGVAVVGGLNDYVEDLLDNIRETSAISGEEPKDQVSVLLIIQQSNLFCSFLYSIRKTKVFYKHYVFVMNL